MSRRLPLPRRRRARDLRGQGASLRKRLASYWGKPLHPRTAAMVEAAASVEWIVASGEVDALMLEYNLIQPHRPRFNIRYRDDKSYPYLALTVGETWPRAQVLRGAKRKGVRYFGPYGHAWAIRDTLDALTRVFPVRTCSNAFFDQRARARRPCLYYDIGRCAGPCVPEVTGVTEEGYRDHVDAMAAFLAGDAGRSCGGSSARCARPPSTRSSSRRRSSATSCSPRGGRSSRRRWCSPSPRTSTWSGWPRTTSRPRSRCSSSGAGGSSGARAGSSTGWRSSTGPSWSRSFLEQLYMERHEVPARVLVPTPPADADLLEAWLEGAAAARSGSRFPSEGRSASSSRSSRATPRRRSTGTSSAAPRTSARGRARSRSWPISSGSSRRRSGSSATTSRTSDRPTRSGSMVVFEDGLPKRSDYRRFQIKGVRGQDDFASMEEMLRRRFTRLLEERAAAAGRAGAGSPTRRRSSWSTAGGASSRRRRGSSPSSACRSRTSGWRSGSRRSTSRTAPTR